MKYGCGELLNVVTSLRHVAPQIGFNVFHFTGMEVWLLQLIHDVITPYNSDSVPLINTAPCCSSIRSSKARTLGPIQLTQPNNKTISTLAVKNSSSLMVRVPFLLLREHLEWYSIQSLSPILPLLTLSVLFNLIPLLFFSYHSIVPFFSHRLNIAWSETR